MADGWQPKRVLITVRTYPTPARKGIEVSCTAGITDDGEWIRLFPIPYRYMAEEARFRKYQWITLNVRKASGDPRPESYTPDLDSIQLAEVVPPTNAWAARKALLWPVTGPSMCGLQQALRGRRGQRATLGLVKPRSIDRFVIRRDNPQWSADDLARLLQQPLGGTVPKQPLEKMPVKFTYEFHCEGDDCTGHKLRCTDWEMCETYRSWIRQYGNEDGERRFRQRFFDEMVERNDTRFYVGTHSLYPTWMVVGLFYPPKTAQEALF
jgi:hypothetical protein